MNNPIEQFKEEVKQNIEKLGEDTQLRELSEQWFCKSMDDKYSYNFRWMGRPIIQYPQDIMAMQEIIWDVKPDLIIETGIAHGGSLIFYASLLTLLGNHGHVLGIDIDIREHNRTEIEHHPMFDKITMYEGSSIDKDMIQKVFEFAKDYQKILVVLDSCHTGSHVLEECRLYSPLVKQGSYLVVMDTCSEMIYRRMKEANEELPEHLVRPWKLGDNAMTGMQEFLKENDRFQIDTGIDHKLQISCAPNGYLQCIKD
ncbi:MAG: cephalosporin hydroxylase [Lachnospiraceae bacterium]|nr:cephalosporin hydroxylase [Lachnospiraceae bacterium]